MLQLGLIGQGISRTRVHHLHTLLGELAGISVTYTLLDTALPETALPKSSLRGTPGEGGVDLGPLLRRCAAEGYAGVNVTHPYKLDAFALVDDAAWLPKGLTSVNTVVFEPLSETGAVSVTAASNAGYRLRGDNTDYSGFLAAYRGRFGNLPPGDVLLLGAGGVGVSIALALLKLGAGKIAIHDSNAARADALAARVRSSGGSAQAVPGGLGGLQSAAKAATGLVNATPVGMHQYPGNALPDGCMGGQRWAFDAVYTPRDTEFLRSAEAYGLEVLGGYELFLHQGFDAFERFSGRAVDRSAAARAFAERSTELHGDLP